MKCSILLVQKSEGTLKILDFLFFFLFNTGNKTVLEFWNFKTKKQIFVSWLFNIQESALFLGHYLNVGKFVILTMLNPSDKRLDFLWVLSLLLKRVQTTVQWIWLNMDHRVLHKHVETVDWVHTVIKIKKGTW